MLNIQKFKSIFDLLRAFPDEQSCIQYLEHLRWNGNVTSPFDHAGKVYTLANNRYKCRSSNKYFNVRTDTIFEGTKIPLRTWFLAIYLFTSHKKGISSYQLAKDIDITQKSAWFMLQRIRYAMEHETYFQQLEGNIQVDEAFVGGKNKNRHADKKVKQSQGRSFKDKTPVLGILQTAEFKIVERPNKLNPDKTVTEKVILKEAIIRCQVIPNTSAKVIQPILGKVVKYGSNLISDEWSAYKGLNRYFVHQIVDHSKGQYVNESNGTTNGVENFWTHFKRSWGTTYSGRITPKHLQKYSNEFAFRYNTRNKTTAERFNILLQGTCGKRLTYKLLLQQ